MANPRLCSIPDCGKPHKGRGYCVKHLGRLKRHGDPLKGRLYPERGEPMAHLLAHMWDDCPKWPYARGKGGYGRIQHEGVVKDIHRVVCEMVHGPAPTSLHDAAHSCGKGDEGCFGANCLSWKTRAENLADCINHGTSPRGEKMWMSKLTEDDVRQIRKLRGRMPHKDVASKFGISRPYVSDLQTGRAWAWLD